SIEDISGNKISISYTDELDYSPEELRSFSFTDNWQGVATYDNPNNNEQIDVVSGCVPDVFSNNVDDIIDWENSEGFDNNFVYTRSSYIDNVVFPSGKTIDFVLGNRTDYSDPSSFYFTDENMKLNGIYNEELHSQCRAGECATIWKPYLYNTKKLEKFQIKAANGEVVEEVRFVYSYKTIGSQQRLFLDEVYEYFPESDQRLPGYVFGYYDDGRLKNVTYPTGGYSEVIYENLTTYYSGYVDQGQTPSKDIYNPQKLVSSVISGDGLGNEYTTTYDYSEAISNLADCDYVDNIDITYEGYPSKCGFDSPSASCVFSRDDWGNYYCSDYTYSSVPCTYSYPNSYCNNAYTCPQTRFEGFAGCKDNGEIIFNKVKEILPAGTGYNEYYFYNDLDDSVDSNLPNLDDKENPFELQGLNYMVKSYDTNGKLVKENYIDFQAAQVAFGVDIGLQEEYNRRPVSEKSIVDGVLSNVDYEYYELECESPMEGCPEIKIDANGAPKKTIIYGNDGEKVITESYPYFLNYNLDSLAELAGEKNMLNLPLQTTIFDDDENILTKELFSYSLFDNVPKLSQIRSYANPPNTDPNDIMTNFVNYDSKGNLLEIENSLGNSQKVYYGSSATEEYCVNLENESSEWEQFDNFQIYLPGVGEEFWNNCDNFYENITTNPTYYYVAEDGSTYYDVNLTQLVAGPGTSQTPLLVSDVTSIVDNFSHDFTPYYIHNASYELYLVAGDHDIFNDELEYLLGLYMEYNHDYPYSDGLSTYPAEPLKLLYVCTYDADEAPPENDFYVNMDGEGFGYALPINPTCSENALGHQSIAKYDEWLRLYETNDINGFATKYFYDDFNRLDAVRLGEDTFDSIEYTYNYGLSQCSALDSDDDDCMNWVKTTTVIDNSITKSANLIALSDGLGRSVESRSIGDTVEISSFSEYNSLGLLDKVREPSTSINADYTKYIYSNNPLSRVSKVYDLSEYDVNENNCGTDECAQIVYSTTNLLINPSFEDELDSWTITSGSFLTTDVSYVGLAVKANSSSISKIYQSIDFEGNKTYHYAAWIYKNSSCSGNPYISITKTGVINISDEASNNGWQLVEGVINTSGVNSGKLNLSLVAPANCRAVFDETWFSEYQPNTKVTISTDQNGKQSYSYTDVLGRTTKIINAESEATSYEYDLKGQLVRVVDPLGRIALEYVYDNVGNVLQETRLNSGNVVFTYDSLGNVLTKTDALGKEYSYEYDELNRLVQVELDSEVLIDYFYDENS
nr:hypothetical protein [Nanoarchaeum sp.]